MRTVELVPQREIRSTLVSGDFKSYQFITTIAEQNGDRVVGLIGDRQIRFAIVVEITCDQRPRALANRYVHVRLKCAVSVAEQDRDCIVVGFRDG